MAVLANYLVTTEAITTRIFTPAALNTYIDCSLRFYFKYILKLSSASTLSDQATDAIQFGTMLHKVLEQLYQKLIGNHSQVIVQHTDIIILKSQMKKVLTDTLNTYIYEGCSKAVWWIIEQAIIEKVVDKILDLDAAYAPFELLGIEVGNNGSLVTPFRLKNGKTMYMGNAKVG